MLTARIATVVLLLGGLAACSGDDGDGDAADAPRDASKEGFCKEYNGLYDRLMGQSPGDPSSGIKGLKDWADDIEDYGTPKEMSDQARKGFEVVIGTVEDVSADAKPQDLEKLGDDLSAADEKAAEAFGEWTDDNCPKPDLALPSTGS